MLTRQMIPAGRGEVSGAEGSQGDLLSLEPWCSMSHLPPSLPMLPWKMLLHASLRGPHPLPGCSAVHTGLFLTHTSGISSPRLKPLPWLPATLRIKFKCLNLAVKAFHYLHFQPPRLTPHIYSSKQPSLHSSQIEPSILLLGCSSPSPSL